MNEVHPTRRETGGLGSVDIPAQRDFARPEDFDRWVVPADRMLPGAILAGG
jgi:hypothetical protein